MLESLKSQVGGDHYQSMKIQPAEYILANGLGHYEAAAVEYISRWQLKGGIASLEKAQQCLQILIDYQRQQDAKPIDNGHQATVEAARKTQQEAQYHAASKQAKGQPVRA
jgi:hypothetical protein